MVGKGLFTGRNRLPPCTILVKNILHAVSVASLCLLYEAVEIIYCGHFDSLSLTHLRDVVPTIKSRIFLSVCRASSHRIFRVSVPKISADLSVTRFPQSDIGYRNK